MLSEKSPFHKACSSQMLHQVALRLRSADILAEKRNFELSAESTLGPLFFLVYINDIKSALGNINMFLFADDTVLLLSNKSAKSARDKLEEKLSQLLIWCRQNKLTMNLTKTKCMIFGTKQKVKISNLKKIKLDRAELDYVNSYKYLGIRLDKSLTYIKHIQSCISNVSHKMFILSKIIPYINTKMAITIYTTHQLNC